MFRSSIKTESGYTLIETMISISLFVIIVMAGMGALVNANFLYDKSHDMRSVINNLNFALEDMSRSLFIAGFRTVFLVEQQILNTKSMVNNFTLVFNQSFFGGTYNGVLAPVMTGATFGDMVKNMNISANKVNAVVSLTNASVYATQDDPWNVKFVLKGRLIVKDNDNLVGWDKEEIVYSYVPIKYFDDPIYIVNSNGLYSNKMIKTPYFPFVSGNNLANLSLHAQGSYYINYSGAPSFIDRLEGNFTHADINGVESLVNVKKLFDLTGESAKTKSIRDFVYFSSSGITPFCRINSPVPDWVLIDNQSIYNIYGAGGEEFSCV